MFSSNLDGKNAKRRFEGPHEQRLKHPNVECGHSSADGSSSLIPSAVSSSIEDEEALVPLFDEIMRILRAQDVLKDSPTFFPAYAWDVEGEPEANSAVVEQFIEWFRTLDKHFTFYSDKTIPMATAVTDGQEKLLPPHDYPAVAADRIILCSSLLLQKYMATNEYKAYAKDMVQEYLAHRNTLSNERRSGEGIDISKNTWPGLQKVQQRHEKLMREAGQNAFHHVLTEMALLEVRNATGCRETIIPLLMNGDIHCFPSYVLTGNNPLRVKLSNGNSNSTNNWSKYTCFLHILEKIVCPKGKQSAKSKLIRRLNVVYMDASNALSERYQHPSSNSRDEIVNQFLRKDCNKEHSDWIREDMTSKNGVSVADVRKALQSYHESLWQFESVMGDNIHVEDFHCELNVLSKDDHGQTTARSTITLKEIFNHQELWKGGHGKPRRIHIRGAPGVGKTTLCRQILYEYGREGTLGAVFKWVILIRLRDFDSVADLEAYFVQHYFFSDAKRKEKAGLLDERVCEQDREATLLILDGWDEVSNWDAPCHRVNSNVSPVRRLLNDFPNIVVTSRFGIESMETLNIHLALEISGFSLNEIDRYLSHYEHQDESYAKDIREHLFRNIYLMDFARTPLHLELICVAWRSIKTMAELEEAPTICSLYRAIELELLRKDALRLGTTETTTNIPLTESEMRFADLHSLRSILGSELTVLSELAFLLMQRNGTSFNINDVTSIVVANRSEGSRTSISLYDRLTKLSFVRSQDSRLDMHFTFIHLTFQEYLAAYWLAKHPVKLHELVRHQKYNKWYERVWLFVPGFLSDDEAGICAYFEAMDQKPRELLGPEHICQIIDCLSQVPIKGRARLETLRDRFEDRLKALVVLATKIDRDAFRDCGLQKYINNRVAKDLLKEMNAWYQMNMLSEVLESPALLANDDMNFKKLAQQTLREGAPESMFSILQASLPEEAIHMPTINNMVAPLAVEERDHVLSIVDKFQCHSSSTDMLAAISRLMAHENLYIRAGAINALVSKIQERPLLGEDVLRQVLELLREDNTNVREGANAILSSQHRLPENVCGLLMDLVEDNNCCIKPYAVNILSQQRSLSESLLDRLVNLLFDRDSEAEKILCNIDWPQDISKEKLAKLLGHEDHFVWRKALKVLSNHSFNAPLSKDNVDACLNLLNRSGSSLERVTTLSHVLRLYYRRYTMLCSELLDSFDDIIRCPETLEGHLLELIKALQDVRGVSLLVIFARALKVLELPDFAVYQKAIRVLAAILRWSLQLETFESAIMPFLHDIAADGARPKFGLFALEMIREYDIQLSTRIQVLIVLLLKDGDIPARASILDALSIQRKVSEHAGEQLLLVFENNIGLAKVISAFEDFALSEQSLPAARKLLYDRGNKVTKQAYFRFIVRYAGKHELPDVDIRNFETLLQTDCELQATTFDYWPKLPDHMTKIALESIRCGMDLVTYIEGNQQSDNMLEALKHYCEHHDNTIRRTALCILVSSSQTSNATKLRLIERALKASYAPLVFTALDALFEIAESIPRSTTEKHFNKIYRLAVETYFTCRNKTALHMSGQECHLWCGGRQIVLEGLDANALEKKVDEAKKQLEVDLDEESAFREEDGPVSLAFRLFYPNRFAW